MGAQLRHSEARRRTGEAVDPSVGQLVDAAAQVRPDDGERHLRLGPSAERPGGGVPVVLVVASNRASSRACRAAECGPSGSPGRTRSCARGVGADRVSATVHGGAAVRLERGHPVEERSAYVGSGGRARRR
ncbi:hypothetical protein LUR56_08270 [Streptomyces sp. MT29]|nr:hypothetical protein [Streptomyces sp. MT29]